MLFRTGLVRPSLHHRHSQSTRAQNPIICMKLPFSLKARVRGANCFSSRLTMTWRSHCAVGPLEHPHRSKMQRFCQFFHLQLSGGMHHLPVLGCCEICCCLEVLFVLVRSFCWHGCVEHIKLNLQSALIGTKFTHTSKRFCSLVAVIRL